MDANQVVQFALLGLGAGAAYALLGHGVIVIYRGSGIVNFSQGAMAMAAAFLFWELHDRRGWAFWPSAVLGVAFVAVIGLLFQLVVMRSMSRSSPLARLIATLGLLSVLSATMGLLWGHEQQLVTTSLPQANWTITNFGLDVVVPSSRIYLFLIALALTAGLWFLYRFTRFGLAVTAAAENERAASSLGCSSSFLAAANWCIGGALAGIAGILIVPLTGLQIESGTNILIAALAAALAGSFSSFPLTLIGGVAIGVIQSELARFGSDLFGSTRQTGMAASLPFIVIIALLVIRGRALPLRSHVLERLPKLGTGVVRPLPVMVSAVVVAALVLAVFTDNATYAAIQMVLAAIMILSLVVLTGYAGQLSLGQYALGGVGAFFAGRLLTRNGFLAAGLPIEVSFLLGILGAALFGLVFALPALRTRGVNLAVVTLGLGLAVQSILFANSLYTGGSDGTPIGETKIFGYSVDATLHPERYFVLSLFWLVVAVFVVGNLRRGRGGKRLIAVRTNERAAASLGISVVVEKLYAFTISAGIAGLAGILIAFQGRSIVYTHFDPFLSINAVMEAVIGGVGYIVGSIFGSLLAPGALPSLWVGDFVGNPGEWLALVSGVLLIVTLIAQPDGVASKVVRDIGRYRRSSVAIPTETAAREPRPQRVRPATLTTHDLHVCLGGVEILRGVDLTVAPGQVLGLIGPNGAGKTTLIDAASGFVKPSGGSITLDGHDVTRWSPTRRARSGVTRSFQSLELFEGISVRENLHAASDPRDWTTYFVDLCWPLRQSMSPAAVAAIDEFKLTEDLDRAPDELSYGRRRLLGIARAIATSPSILLLDEPAAGLSAHESAELGFLVRRLADDWGIGILLVEHDMSVVMSICDEVVVMEFGQKIAHGTPAQVSENASVIAAYLGDDIDAGASPAPIAPARVGTLHSGASPWEH